MLTLKSSLLQKRKQIHEKLEFRNQYLELSQSYKCYNFTQVVNILLEAVVLKRDIDK